jgi:hypothetical protein
LSLCFSFDFFLVSRQTSAMFPLFVPCMHVFMLLLLCVLAVYVRSAGPGPSPLTFALTDMCAGRVYRFE